MVSTLNYINQEQRKLMEYWMRQTFPFKEIVTIERNLLTTYNSKKFGSLRNMMFNVKR